MTNEEFSNEFDTLANSYSALGTLALEFDEYEKSVFLTKAQESIVISLYNGSLKGEAFEKTEELRRYLSNLVKTNNPTKVQKEGLTNNSYLFSIPEDVWFITYESVISEDDKLGCAKGTIMEVVPVTQDELHKTRRNPFRTFNKRRVLRLDLEDNVVELLSDYYITNYTIRYLSKPDPIILLDLPDGLTINKESKETECKLNPALHRMILELAVDLALKSRVNVGK